MAKRSKVEFDPERIAALKAEIARKNEERSPSSGIDWTAKAQDKARIERLRWITWPPLSPRNGGSF